MGAADPTSGIVSLHEVIRGFGALLKKGWKPLRTGTVRLITPKQMTLNLALIVVIASWDAEEVRALFLLVVT